MNSKHRAFCALCSSAVVFSQLSLACAQQTSGKAEIVSVFACNLSSVGTAFSFRKDLHVELFHAGIASVREGNIADGYLSSVPNETEQVPDEIVAGSSNKFDAKWTKTGNDIFLTTSEAEYRLEKLEKPRPRVTGGGEYTWTIAGSVSSGRSYFGGCLQLL